MQQNYEMFCKRQSSWDPLRTGKMCTTGLAIGPCCHFWYQFLDRTFPGKALGVVMKKIVLDQIIFSPINISIFLLTLGYLEGSSIKTVGKELKEKGAQLLKAEWIVWPPAQLVNFLFVPPRFRVLYDNTVSLGFDYYYSYVKFRKGDVDTEVFLILPSHHGFSTCHQLTQQLAVEKHLRVSSKCLSDLDI